VYRSPGRLIKPGVAFRRGIRYLLLRGTTVGKNGIIAKADPFGGEIIDPGSAACAPEAFREQLDRFIRDARRRRTKVVWLSLDSGRAALIPVAVEVGFRFHHAAGDSVEMTLRLVEGAYIPPYATHYVGAGGLVMKDRDTMLVVAERYGRRGRKHYKLPGGALRPGEHIEKAVLREVREETGIKAKFVSLNCFRHWHGYRYDKSDIYFVCRLEALTDEIRMQEEEIEECLWMPVVDYLENDNVHVFNRRVVSAALSGGGLTPDPIEGYGTPETHELFMPAVCHDDT
jgi:ADP-ribose pyrophosphatase YjhB (NUDIX family)